MANISQIKLPDNSTYNLADSVARESITSVSALLPHTTTISNTAIASFSDGADNVPVSELIFDIKAVQAGSGTPSPDNVRAIIGFDSGVITRCGVNLWDEEWEVGAYSATTGEKVASDSCIRSANKIPIKPNTTYYGYYGKSTDNLYALFYDISGDYININNSAVNITRHTFTTPNNAYYMAFRTFASGVVTDIYENNISINYPSSDTQYHSYIGNNYYTVAFGQTVYGGFFDNRGNLVVTHGIVDLVTLTWTKVTSFTNILFLATVTGKATNNSNIICSNYNNVGIATGGTFLNNMANNSIASDTTTGIYIRDDAKSSLSAADFKTAMSGVMLVYKLDGGPSFPVAGQDVRTLLGNNNIFVNTGNIRRLEYFKTGCENIAKLIEAAPNPASVQSVNGQTGAVELDAFNTPYDSENSIAEKVEKLTVKLTLAEYNALTEKAPNTRYIITDAPALEYTAEDLSYDGGADTVWDKVEEKANSADLATVAFTGKYKDLTGLLTSLHTGSSVVEAGGSISLSESPSNFMYLLIRFQTNSECQYMVLSTSDNMTLQTTISGHRSQGTVTYPIAYNSTIGVKINGNKLDVINLVYNNVNYKARVSNVWGLIRTNA